MMNPLAMLRRFRGALLGAAVAALALATTTALAGSGVGGVFNLGQLNSVDAQSTLSGNAGTNPELKVVNSGTGTALNGVAASGVGVNGISTSGTGQRGQSTTGIGLIGIHSDTSGTNPGVQGQTASTDPGAAGVVGRNTGGGPALRAIVNAGAPPLMVSNQVKVQNLNADLLDGLDSTALQKRVSGTCAAGSAIKMVNAEGSVSCEPVGIAGAWGLSGNSGTAAGTNFLGTTDNQPLVVKTGAVQGWELKPSSSGMDTPSVVGGYSGNSVLAQQGGTIAGGGSGIGANTVVSNFGSVGGGLANTAGNLYATVGGGTSNTAGETDSTVSGGAGNTGGGPFSTVPGGADNAASGFYSFAAGRRAKATQDGSFVWGDSTDADVTSPAADTFTVRAHGGVWLSGGTGLFGTIDNQALDVEVDGQRALRLEPQMYCPYGICAFSPNVVGGYAGNGVDNGAAGAVIGGGGVDWAGNVDPNLVSADFGTIGGGFGNTVSGPHSTVDGGDTNTADGTNSTVGGGDNNSAKDWGAVPGGEFNTATGAHSFAAGRKAKATQNGSFVWADETDADLTSPAANTFTVRASGGIWLGTTSNPSITSGHFIDTSTGAYLSSAGAWTNNSDRAKKHEFQRIDPGAVLGKVARMPITSWSYKAEQPSVRHIGPTAQDFYKAFGLGLDDKHIATIDEGGVALAAIKGLYRQNQALEHQNRELRARLTAQDTRLASQGKRLDSLARALSKLTR